MDDPPLLIYKIFFGISLLGVFVFNLCLMSRHLKLDISKSLKAKYHIAFDLSLLFSALVANLIWQQYDYDLLSFILLTCFFIFALIGPRLWLFFNISKSKDVYLKIKEVQENFGEGLIDFAEGVVSEVMVPLSDVFLVSEDAVINDILKDIDYKPYSRIPVYRGLEKHNIVGIVYSKDLIRHSLNMAKSNALKLPLKGLVRETLYVPEVMEQAELLIEFQKKQVQIAVVIDEYGMTSGIVTLEDLLETVVGEMYDKRNDSEEMVIKKGTREWEFDAMLDLESFSETVNKDFDSDAVETLGGLVFMHFGSLPKIGETMELSGFLFTVLDMDGFRLRKILVREVGL